MMWGAQALPILDGRQDHALMREPAQKCFLVDSLATCVSNRRPARYIHVLDSLVSKHCLTVLHYPPTEVFRASGDFCQQFDKVW